MTATAALLSLLATGAVGFPGWLIAQTFRVPHAHIAGFITGTVGLLLVVLGLDACHVRLSLGTVGSLWLALTGLALVLFVRRRSVSGAPALASAATANAPWPLLLALLPAVAVVAWRAFAQPLSGIDTVFRWDFLATQMLSQGSLAFYPPVTAADFSLYGWPDGIPPAVSALYFWVYAVAGATAPALTAPVVLGQFLLLLAAVHALTRRLFSARAAAFACVFAAGTPVLLWATLMGQETGLTALSLVGLFLYLPRDRGEEHLATVAVAALAASLGALSREYGLAFPALGLGLALARRLSVRAIVVFLLVTILAVAPWYLRNWLHTGNPLYNLALGGWFPVNRAHLALMEIYQSEFGWSHLPPAAPRLLVVNCLLALGGALAGAFLFLRTARALFVAFALVVFLWAISLGYTAAGFTYALRVLNPALALGAVLGGAAVARWIPDRRNFVGATVALSLLSLDAALRTLVLPANVYRLPFAEWLTAGGAAHAHHSRPVYGEIARLAAGRRMLVLGPDAILTRHGAHTAPLWSPEARSLFATDLAPAEVVRQLRAGGLELILLSRGELNQRYISTAPFFREALPFLRQIWADEELFLFEFVSPPASPLLPPP
jgi:hypothetical protein